MIPAQIGTQRRNHHMGIVWVAIGIVQGEIQLDIAGIGRHRRVLEPRIFHFQLNMGGRHAQIVHDAFHGKD